MLDGAGGDALDEALAEGRVFFADGEEEGLEGLVVGAGEEGFAAGGEGEAVTGPAGSASFGLVGEEPLGFERLEVLAGGALGEEGTGGDFLHGGEAEPAYGDEDGPAGRVEEVEAGGWGHGGKVWGAGDGMVNGTLLCLDAIAGFVASSVRNWRAGRGACGGRE